MSVQIIINGENAAEALSELSSLAGGLTGNKTETAQASTSTPAAPPALNPSQGAPAAFPTQQPPAQGYPFQQQAAPQPFGQAPQGGVPVQQPAPQQQPAQYQQPVQQPQQGVVPTAAAQEYSFDQIGVAATSLMESRPETQQMMLDHLRGQYGAGSLMELPKEQYGAFATYLRSLGARI